MQAEDLRPKVVYFMSLMEVFYRVWKDQGEKNGRLAYYMGA